MDELRLSVPGDEAELKGLWARVFGDAEETIDGFFEKIYAPGMASVYVHEGRAVSAAYLVKLGELVCDGRRTPCKVVYAYGTDQNCRGRGFGGKVLRHALDRAAASGVTAICPAEPSLFDYYKNFGFTTFFHTAERNCVDDGRDLSGAVARVTVRGYAALREELLQGRAHVDFDMRALEYQEFLCRQSGGGLYYVEAGDDRCCAAVEIEGDEAKIRELIAPAGGEDAATLVCRAVRRAKCSCRAPVAQGDTALPFAMLAGPASPPLSGIAPWLGFDFG